MTGSAAFGAYASTVPNTVAEPLTSNFNISCSLDGAEIPTIPLSLFSSNAEIDFGDQNNLLLCFNNPNNSGEHELLISTSIIPASRGWLFDYIVFESMVNPHLDGEVLQAGNGEFGNATNYSMLTFGPGWTHTGPNIIGPVGVTGPGVSSITDITHSSATMKFNGKY